MKNARHPWKWFSERPPWVQVIGLGLLGGPITGVAFGVGLITVLGVLAGIRSTNSIPESVAFLIGGFVVGAIVGLLLGLIVATVGVIAYLASIWIGNPIARGLIVATATSASTAVCCYTIIAPLVVSFNPFLFAIILSPMVGAAYFLVVRSALARSRTGST